jgi:hypothetical protein
MSRRWRFFWLALLATLMVGGVERLSSRTLIPDEQASDESPPPPTESNSVQNNTHVSRKTARLVPLYPAGSLYVKEPEPEPAEPEPEPEPVRAEPESPSARAPDTTPASPIPPLRLEGKRPALEVDYETIGFERYLDVIERVGRLFVLLKGKNGVGLGPEVSLRQGIVLQTGGHDMDVLATNRPHLISDPRIRESLAAIGLPADAHEDRLVLMLTRPFDSLLWDTVWESLYKQGLAIENIAQIKGAYVEGRNGVFLRLDTAVAKEGNMEYPLSRELRVSL